MKSLKTLVSLSALAVCMGAASMANAYSISPVSTSFTAPGTISVKSPSSFQATVNCGATFTGNVDATGVAKITGVAVTGGGLCALPKITGLPWTLTATGPAAGSVTNVGYTIASSILYPASNCGPSTITVGYSGGVLTAANQTLSGSCTVVSLSVTPSPALTIVP
ncbi:MULTISPECIES: alkane oxidation protein activator PraB [Pseudomonas]|uniref:Alkane oxidation protein activator PraB n=1 Tax=Pseudomonas pergaminensis TaxID=2853159 RepID=A0ABD7TAU1_9PSED|nr:MULTISPECIES: alkane oxidation protein activator PraB [Pseudomonas]AQT94731.1 protein activator of alkane oxidation PraB [Pseudomonas azotoformans]MBT1260080.1 protein activator of alkane oxidation PraB [Pseudomonas sp. VS40]MBT1272078.1 protein activator of alkane oxidation PraB [Pseudomonas sp. VS59]PJK32618.1 protein activator of alkane oxidation PraB [Pseudomonas sp. S09F 262]PJK42107.1 protein activator of alkane oxidation PraB [Pseudomonas sp. S10E 269]